MRRRKKADRGGARWAASTEMRGTAVGCFPYGWMTPHTPTHSFSRLSSPKFSCVRWWRRLIAVTPQPQHLFHLPRRPHFVLFVCLTPHPVLHNGFQCGADKRLPDPVAHRWGRRHCAGWCPGCACGEWKHGRDEGEGGCILASDTKIPPQPPPSCGFMAYLPVVIWLWVEISGRSVAEILTGAPGEKGFPAGLLCWTGWPSGLGGLARFGAI